MTKALTPFRFALISLAVAMLSSCATMSPPSSGQNVDFRVEDFGSSDTFSRVFPGTGKTTCEAARRALLSQGYVIVGDSNDSQVRGRKNFQPDRDVHEQIEFYIVCAPNAKGSNSATAFANAVLDRYSLKKSTSSASLGVGVLGSVSLPFGSTDDALVKVASETISRRKFYDRFFEVMESYLDNSIVERAEEGTLDSKAPEQKAQEVRAPEAKPQDAGAVGMKAPETKVPETKIPEPKMPEPKVSETKASEAKPSEATPPEQSPPETKPTDVPPSPSAAVPTPDPSSGPAAQK